MKKIIAIVLVAVAVLNFGVDSTLEVRTVIVERNAALAEI